MTKIRSPDNLFKQKSTAFNHKKLTTTSFPWYGGGDANIEYVEDGSAATGEQLMIIILARSLPIEKNILHKM